MNSGEMRAAASALAAAISRGDIVLDEHALLATKSVEKQGEKESEQERELKEENKAQAIIAYKCIEVPQLSGLTDCDKTFPLFGNEISNELFDWLMLRVGSYLHPIEFEGEIASKIDIGAKGLPKAELFMLININKRCRERVPRNNLLFSTAALHCLQWMGINIRAPVLSDTSAYDEVRLIDWMKLSPTGNVEDFWEYLADVRGFLQGSNCINSMTLDSQCDCGGKITGNLHELLDEPIDTVRRIGDHLNTVFVKWAEDGVGVTNFEAKCNTCPYHLRLPFKLTDAVICREPSHDQMVPSEGPPAIYHRCGIFAGSKCAVIICEYCAMHCDSKEECDGGYCINCVDGMACDVCGICYCMECRDGEDEECMVCEDLICSVCLPGKADSLENCALAAEGKMPVPDDESEEEAD